MPNSLFNLLIILIPLAIFVGRIVVQARGKHSPPPKIPVHFEDDKDDEDYYAGPKAREEFAKTLPELRKKLHAKANAGKKIAPTMSSVDRGAVESSTALKAEMASGRVTPVQAVPDGKPFPQNVARLSPLKQAVVMAEVLGPPLALRE